MPAEKILLIDDEEDYCLLMKNYFARKNYKTETAFTLREGLKKLDEFRPDILFLDNNLPDGHGWSHVDDILTKLPLLRIHLISAYNPKTENIHSLAEVKVWEKPISLENLDAFF
jgi:DNA-binding response OmpR family regulator